MDNLIARIQDVLEKKNISFSEFSEHLGISEPTLKEALQNNSIEIRTLERISKDLKIPLYRFFREPLGDLLENAKDHPVYAAITHDELAQLKFQLEIAQKEISLLKKEIEERNTYISELKQQIK